MTLAELATHNKAGNCYIGYNGIVYNVSNHASWSGCFHHGIGGGQDITSRFPHPVSYLSGLPRVANLTGGQVRNSNSTSTVEHETESEIENEKEKQETPNYEKTENHNGGENNGQDD
jgi:predicted heme/steroid binding protein